MVTPRNAQSILVYFAIFFIMLSQLTSAVLLEDGDWEVEIDEDFGHITTWENADSEFLFEHNFWYRTDSSSAELPFNDDDEFTLVDSNFTSSTATLEYEGDQFNVAINYELTSGAEPEESSIKQEITFTNTTNDSLDLHWFEYTDLDITPFDANMAFGDVAFITQFVDPAFLSGDPQIFIHDTILGGSALPNFFEIDEVDNFDDIFDRLDDGLPTTLSFSSFNDDFAQNSVDDLAFARQWNFVLPGSESTTITSEKMTSLDDQNANPIPEPSTVIFVLMGLVAIGYLRINKTPSSD